jgi:hypothetical protein
MQASTGSQHAAPACVGSPKEGSLGLVPSSKSFRAVYTWAPLGRKEGRAQAAREERAVRRRQSAEVFRVHYCVTAAWGACRSCRRKGAASGARPPGRLPRIASAAGPPRSINLPLQWPSGVPRRCGVPCCQPCTAGVGGSHVVVAFAAERVRPGWVSALCGSAPVDPFRAAGICCC